MAFRNSLGCMGWGVALALVVLASPSKAAPVLAADGHCSDQTARFERLYGIPSQLLDAISIVESGRFDQTRKATLAWPWTVTANGEGKYFPSKAEAVAEVRRLKGQGVRNIDVGCMQVNLKHHPEAFSDLEEAFEPVANVAYAARFLKGLFEATGHWPTAASYYHSQTPHLAAAYRARLMKVWNGAGVAQALAHLPHTPTQKPIPPSSQRVEDMRKAWKDQAGTSRGEAQRIAAAYRQARKAEYLLRREKMAEARRANGLPADGY